MLLSIEEYDALGFEGAEDVEACEKAIIRAEYIIDVLTNGKCKDENIPNQMLRDLKQAVAAQAEMYLQNDECSAAGKTTIGEFSHTPEDDSVSTVSPLAMTILKLSGMYYKINNATS